MIRGLFVLLSLFSLAEAQSSITEQPQPAKSFNLTYIQGVESCSYNVLITTSCSSPQYTRDEISIAFGDAYQNQIYAPRIDDPSSRAFEQCSSDSYDISGPCAYQICYVYLYRSGPDNWMPESVKIFSYNSKTVTFYFNTYVPSDVWFGVNLCGNASSLSLNFSRRWLLVAIAALLFVLL